MYQKVDLVGCFTIGEGNCGKISGNLSYGMSGANFGLLSKAKYTSGLLVYISGMLRP